MVFPVKNSKSDDARWTPSQFPSKRAPTSHERVKKNFRLFLDFFEKLCSNWKSRFLTPRGRRATLSDRFEPKKEAKKIFFVKSRNRWLKNKWLKFWIKNSKNLAKVYPDTFGNGPWSDFCYVSRRLLRLGLRKPGTYIYIYIYIEKYGCIKVACFFRALKASKGVCLYWILML